MSMKPTWGSEILENPRKNSNSMTMTFDLLKRLKVSHSVFVTFPITNGDSHRHLIKPFDFSTLSSMTSICFISSSNQDVNLEFHSYKILHPWAILWSNQSNIFVISTIVFEKLFHRKLIRESSYFLKKRNFKMKFLFGLMISIQATTTEPGEACPGKFSDLD